MSADGRFYCGKRKNLLCSTGFCCITGKNLTCSACNDIFFLQFHICTQNSSRVYDTKKLLYILSCAPTPWKRLDQVFSGTDGCGEHSTIPWQSGKSWLAFMLPTLLHLSGLAQVSAAAAAILSFAPWRGRAILGSWSVSVGGARCCFAHCWGRC